MTTATPALLADETHSGDVQGETMRLTGLPLRDSSLSHEASLAALALGSKTVTVEERRRWWASEHDIMVASISVIFAALFAIIVVAAAAVLTMG
ncbi:hypothetical protein MSAS_28980 [Mycobacterium saskatchewanense]|uniref:Uncharacterized protein n=1 Tax=Mycobacterium saskatchewanense TaxID=220927 RepID=A0AAJ3NRY4_9MYCO|nr:hypothetical protein [Mycobacterium saskatchewanense]ORW72387.1 hypothetical protein AWC23_10910 [Mycobacterium saskatchewanense]BBX63724.1 hypothetical protein MSAS_28980 [Mycobacterium saskatchewanense]